MGLFEFKQDQIVPTKELLTLKPFEKLVKHKDRDKLLSYVYHMADYNSPYAIFDDKEQKLNEALLDGKKPSKDILDAIKMYRELSTTETLLLVESARKAAKNLREYFDTIDLSEVEDSGKAAKDLIMNLKAVGQLIDSLKHWEEIAKKEMTQDTTRKGVQIGRYNSGE
jgi:hypothetical protein